MVHKFLKITLKQAKQTNIQTYKQNGVEPCYITLVFSHGTLQQ